MELILIIGFVIILMLLGHFGLLPRGGRKGRRMPETRQELDTDLMYGGGLDTTGDSNGGAEKRDGAKGPGR